MRNLADLRICFLAGTLGQGGAERQLYYILRSLRDSGSDVTLLTLTQGEHWETAIAELGVPIRYVGGAPSRFARCRAITREVKALKPDIVHSQHFYTNLYAVAAARWCRSREVGSLRSDVIHEVKAHSRTIGAASLRWPRTIAVNSQQGRRNALQLGVKDSQLHFLPNVIAHERYLPAAHLSSTEIEICFVARLTKLKRVDVFLRVVAQVRRQCAGKVTATIVGDGPVRKEMEVFALELGMTGDCVRFVGAVDDPQPYLQRSDIAMLTSDWEGTPNVVLEAMATGLPVVATDVGGVSDLVQPGVTGFLAPAGDVDALAVHVRRLAEDGAMRRQFGELGKLAVAENHSIDSLPANLYRVYSAALAQ
jgi:glycosyltransferase involved in cell wall biosynthesis